MALERWFRRKRPTRADDDPSPAGLWLKCEDCSAQIYRKDLEKNLYLCTECGHHYRMPADARVAMLADPGTFERLIGPWLAVAKPRKMVRTTKSRSMACAMARRTSSVVAFSDTASFTSVCCSKKSMKRRPTASTQPSCACWRTSTRPASSS